MYELTDKVLKFDTKETRNLDRTEGTIRATSLLEGVEIFLHLGRERAGPLPSKGEVVYGLRIALEISYNANPIKQEVERLVGVYNNGVGHGDKIQSIQIKNFDSGERTQLRYDRAA